MSTSFIGGKNVTFRSLTCDTTTVLEESLPGEPMRWVNKRIAADWTKGFQFLRGAVVTLF